MKKVYNVLSTRWGFVAAVWSERGLWELTFPRRSAAEALGDLTTSDVEEATVGAMADELAKELKLYYSGYRVDFGVPVDWRGYTPFQTAVLKYTAGIPYGEVTTYGQLAAAVGSPQAARAVGGALHINRTPVVVPCHRVVGAGGSLTGFGGGLDLKKALLLLEEGVSQV